MASIEDAIHDQENEQWEERSLNLLRDSKIDQEFSEAKERKKGGKKHKVKWMKRPMVMPVSIVEFLNEELRENAIRYLSNFLIDKRVEDPDNYYRAGFLLFNSCSTMTILVQEIVDFYKKMVDGTLNVRSIKRLANVLTLLQSVAANNETRQRFVDARVPNYLIPLIQFGSDIEVFDNIRAIALSVIGILCQGRESEIIQWALESDVVAVCHTIIDTGSELNKVIAMHILEAIFQNRDGISCICNSTCDHLLIGLMKTWDKLVNLLAADQDYSPRLLFHIIRCYIILCTDARGLNTVMKCLPDVLTNNSFHDMMKEFPIIRKLIHQLLLYVGKVTEEPNTKERGLCLSDSVSSYVMPQRLIARNQVTVLAPSMRSSFPTNIPLEKRIRLPFLL